MDAFKEVPHFALRKLMFAIIKKAIADIRGAFDKDNSCFDEAFILLFERKLVRHYNLPSKPPNADKTPWLRSCAISVLLEKSSPPDIVNTLLIDIIPSPAIDPATGNIRINNIEFALLVNGIRNHTPIGLVDGRNVLHYKDGDRDTCKIKSDKTLNQALSDPRDKDPQCRIFRFTLSNKAKAKAK